MVKEVQKRKNMIMTPVIPLGAGTRVRAGAATREHTTSAASDARRQEMETCAPTANKGKANPVSKNPIDLSAQAAAESVAPVAPPVAEAKESEFIAGASAVHAGALVGKKHSVKCAECAPSCESVGSAVQDERQ
jgi:hypothetical protein